jgi:hypothetical protein
MPIETTQTAEAAFAKDWLGGGLKVVVGEK